MPKFETFHKRMVPLVKQPYVTLLKQGALSFNGAAYEALGSPKAIELLFDVNERIIGVRGVEATVEHAYPVRPLKGKNPSFMVSGRAFVKYYGISTEVSRRWLAHVDEELGVLCIDLKQPGTEVSSNRSGHKKGSVANMATGQGVQAVVTELD